MYVLFTFAEITLQFLPTMYTVAESEQEVEVCVIVQPGSVQLERPVSYYTQTQDGTALGKSNSGKKDSFLVRFCLSSTLICSWT